MIAVVCHDAGGAELLSSWVLLHNVSCCVVVDGPAKEIFEKKIGKTKNISLESAIADSDWLLSGTSYSSNLEIRAIELARANKKKSVAFLDHWCNYTDRFKREGKMFLPDEIWVGDEEAYKIANKEFSSVKIHLKINPYFEFLRGEFEKLGHKKRNIRQVPTALYVCSPINELALRHYGDEKYWGYTEEEAIRYFMENLYALNYKEINVVIRPHPSENHRKYDWVLNEFGEQVKSGGNKTLLEEVFDAELVVGCNSMAMVVGLIAGKRVISGLPPGHRTYCLPMPEIEHLHNIIEQHGE